MKKTRMSLSILVVLIIFGFLWSWFGPTTAKVTIKAVDEGGLPVKEAAVEIGFFTGIDNNVFTYVRGATDKEGRFSGSASSSPHLSGGVSKDDYYTSIFVYDFSRRNLVTWTPWNPEIEVVLRPIINQVPMYRRGRAGSNAILKIPEVGNPIGFDLLKSDWVAPYGLGEHPDFTFTLERRFTSRKDYDVTLTLSFANKYDGIQVIKDDRGGRYRVGSVFRLPRIAPDSGYQAQLVKNRSGRPLKRGVNTQYDYAEDNNYIFRIRSEADENGHLIQAMYGKIIGDIGIEPRGTDTLTIHFNYALNPDYTQNLEHDPKRNLLNQKQ